MAISLNRLTARTVSALSKPGRHSDGQGLYLVVDKGGAKRWVFLWRQAGRLREMGLGSVTAVSLARARDLAAAARARVAEGGDPIADRRVQPPTPPEVVTFGKVSDDFIEAKSPSWKSAKHSDQWKMTLCEYCRSIRELPVQDVTTDHVLQILRPMWTEKNETAVRLRGRIEMVLDAARVRGLRSGENPARWRGHLSHLLPSPRKFHRGHHKALPFRDVPEFVGKLRVVAGMSALALEFAILTAARSGEVLGAQWAEIDVDNAAWTVPAGRMKGGRTHRVPLGPRALSILRSLQSVRLSKTPDEFLFPGGKIGKPLSSMALDMVVRRLKAEATPHGFRSSFRDWVAEETAFPREVAEMALAHKVGSDVELAYRRTDYFEKRRELMIAWDCFIEGAKSAVTAGELAEIRTHSMGRQALTANS
jgi:integrase